MTRSFQSLCGVALLGAWILLGSGPTVGVRTTFVEPFDGGSNEGGWSFGTGGESIQTSGGNPGAYLFVPVVDTFAPQPRTGFGVASLFTGDYRAQEVTSVGVDLITNSVDFTAEDRPLSVLLVSDNDTPGDGTDDWAAYTIGPTNVPLPGEGWLSYDFDIPSRATSFPAGWSFILYGPNSPPSPDWNQVITDVTQLRFFYGDPELFFIFQQWSLGLDNPRISTATTLPNAPGRVPPTITLRPISPFSIEIAWSDSPCSGADDYAIYEGTLGSWYSHTLPLDCHDDLGDRKEVVSTSIGSRYYLVVPVESDAGCPICYEGSYGLDSASNERPDAGGGSCRVSHALGCP